RDQPDARYERLLCAAGWLECVRQSDDVQGVLQPVDQPCLVGRSGADPRHSRRSVEERAAADTEPSGRAGHSARRRARLVADPNVLTEGRRSRQSSDSEQLNRPMNRSHLMNFDNAHLWLMGILMAALCLAALPVMA